MDPADALADLTEVSSQIEGAVIADADGVPLAASVPEGPARVLATAARELLGDAEQAEAATRAGCLFVARDGDRLVAAVTGRSPPAALVRHDLRGCLGALVDDARAA